MISGVVDDESDAVARFVIESQEARGRLSQDLAYRLLQRETSRGTPLDRHPLYEPESFKVRIRHMRAILRREPHNAIRWADLALAHVNLAQMDQARRAMKVALNLTPTNRYVVRAAIRLYILLDEPERARHVLSDRSLLRDPWLHASELAVSEILQLPARDLRMARRAIDDNKFAPWHLSELAGELATIELRSGTASSARTARRLITKAMVRPTENTLAQIEWAAATHGFDIPAERSDDPPLLFEAKARAHEQAGEFEEALAQGREWQVDQPFDPEPALFSSYIASMALERYDIAIEVARRGLLANPDNVILRNNLIFSLASSGSLEAAKSELEKLGSGDGASEQATLMATRGLVSFRIGDIDRGRSLYRTAVEMLDRDKDDDRAALASLFWAREEILAKTDEWRAVLSVAYSAVARSSAPLAEMWEQRIARLALMAGL